MNNDIIVLVIFMEWYKININDVEDAEFEAFFVLTDSEKRARILRYRNIIDRKRSVCAEMLAKKAIADRFSVSPGEVELSADDKGKPVCKNFKIELSLTHSGDYAACAISDVPIGIDIQKIVPYNPRVAGKVCSKAELEAIEKSGDRAAEFIKLWTKKEAVLKMQGTGFNQSIKDCLDGQRIKTLRFSGYFVSICEKV